MSQCSKCGATFSCGMVDDKSAAPCWCTRFPPLPMPSASTAAFCYCPQCLEQAAGRNPATKSESTAH